MKKHYKVVLEYSRGSNGNPHLIGVDMRNQPCPAPPKVLYVPVRRDKEGNYQLNFLEAVTEDGEAYSKAYKLREKERGLLLKVQENIQDFVGSAERSRKKYVRGQVRFDTDNGYMNLITYTRMGATRTSKRKPSRSLSVKRYI